MEYCRLVRLFNKTLPLFLVPGPDLPIRRLSQQNHRTLPHPGQNPIPLLRRQHFAL